MELERLNKTHFIDLSEMVSDLWPDCDINEEKEYWQFCIENDDQYFALAKIGESYVGFININIRTDYVEGSDFSETAYLEAIFVKEPFRISGVAKFLLENGINWVKSKGLYQLASDTEIDNYNSQAFHKKLGFQEVNRVVCFVKDL